MTLPFDYEIPDEAEQSMVRAKRQWEAILEAAQTPLVMQEEDYSDWLLAEHFRQMRQVERDV